LSFEPSVISELIKLGFVFSVAFSFPLVIFPCRASLNSLLFRRVCILCKKYKDREYYWFLILSLLILFILCSIVLGTYSRIIYQLFARIQISMPHYRDSYYLSNYWHFSPKHRVCSGYCRINDRRDDLLDIPSCIFCIYK